MESNQSQQNQTPQVGTNQETMANNQNGQQNNAVTLDIHNLPPEFQRYLDQERTKASNTARANAKKELAQDENFIAQVRSGLEQEINNTVEEQIKSLNKRISASNVTNVLMSGGITDQEEINFYTEIFASEDIDKSVERATSFVSQYTKSLQSRIDEKKKQDIQTMTTPSTGQSTTNEKNSLQAQLDEARKDTSFQRNIRISSILRQASEKGIELK